MADDSLFILAFYFFRITFIGGKSHYILYMSRVCVYYVQRSVCELSLTRFQSIGVLVIV